jgi:hypothetical protein
MADEKPILGIILALLVVMLAAYLKENARSKLPHPLPDHSFAI